MFKTLESTPDRLAITMGIRPLQTTTATFDKASRKARFERTIFLIPRKPIEVAFDEIETITVVHQSTTGSQGMQVKSDNPLVQLKDGRRFWLSNPGSPADAATAVQQMREFVVQGLPEGSPAPAAMTEQPVVAPHPSRGYRWVTVTVSVLAALAFIVVGAAKIFDFSSLPECDRETATKTVREIFQEKNVKLTGPIEAKTLSSTSRERNCTARADVAGGTVLFDYRLDWDGWTKRVTITRAEVEAKIAQTQLDEVKKAANDFFNLARDSHNTGRPPRQSEQSVKELLDRVFDVSEFEGVALASTDIAKANDWYLTGDRVGTVYMLAGTGTDDVEKLPNDAKTQQRMHRNVAEFAPEFGRYLDFQLKIGAVMMDGEINRMAKGGDDLKQPEVKQEIADVRSTVAESFRGALTTLAYDGVSDDWRQQRLTVMSQMAPRAATFLLPDQANALRDHAATVATFVRDKSVQDAVKALGDKFAGK